MLPSYVIRYLLALVGIMVEYRRCLELKLDADVSLGSLFLIVRDWVCLCPSLHRIGKRGSNRGFHSETQSCGVNNMGSCES